MIHRLIDFIDAVIKYPAGIIIFIIQLIWIIKNWWNPELDILLENDREYNKEFQKVKDYLFPTIIERIVGILLWIYIINDLITNGIQL